MQNRKIQNSRIVKIGENTLESLECLVHVVWKGEICFLVLSYCSREVKSDRCGLFFDEGYFIVDIHHFWEKRQESYYVDA